MRYDGRVFNFGLKLLTGSVLLMAMTSASGQVSPAEIDNPRAKAAEESHISQIETLQQSIGTAKFPYSFRLSRYLHAKPGQRAASDANGIEFVHFRDRVVLKISGIYKVTYGTTQLSQNERASRTFQEVVVPILRFVARQMPQSADYDGLGFEIVYDVRDADKDFDFEGREVLSVVIGRDDAFAFADKNGGTKLQQMLNRSDIFVNGKELGLALGQRDPLNVEALEHLAPRQAEERPSAGPAGTDRLAATSEAKLSPALSIVPSISLDPSISASTSPPSFADAMRLQKQFQPQLNEIVKEGGARLHFVQSAQPSFETTDDQLLLHFTMRNTLFFDRNSTSIYKRAAQSFDLFLAPELKDLLRRLPGNGGYNSLEFSVLNYLDAGKAPVETVDYICPRESMRSFVANRITSQDLINQSVVLVDGVRIGLNLQLVE